MLGAGDAVIFNAAQSHVAFGLFIREQGADRSAQRALRAFHFHNIRSDLDFNAIGNGNGQFTYSGHARTAYQISHKSSPPTFFSWAVIPSNTPLDVDKMQIPRPFCTLGIL